MYIQQAIEKAIRAGWVDLESKDKTWWDKPWGPQPGRSTPLQDVCEEIANGKDKNSPGLSWLLDPLFWQSLGNSLGWAESQEPYACKSCGVIGVMDLNHMSDCPIKYRKLYWRVYWHRFIDHLASNKSTEDFFKDLLTPHSP